MNLQWPVLKNIIAKYWRPMQDQINKNPSMEGRRAQESIFHGNRLLLVEQQSIFFWPPSLRPSVPPPSLPPFSLHPFLSSFLPSSFSLMVYPHIISVPHTKGYWMERTCVPQMAGLIKPVVGELASGSIFLTFILSNIYSYFILNYWGVNLGGFYVWQILYPWIIFTPPSWYRKLWDMLLSCFPGWVNL